VPSTADRMPARVAQLLRESAAVWRPHFCSRTLRRRGETAPLGARHARNGRAGQGRLATSILR
jgi:hypothetical protein